MKYGLSKYDIKYIDEKIQFQKDWIKNNLSNFEFENETKDALDFIHSAVINPKRYFAEMNNRINSIFDLAKEMNLKPVFLTFTAPAKYHKTDSKGNLLVKPNQTAKDMTQIWNRFTGLNVFRKMKKEYGKGLIYFRVYEPHKSGVPHMHAMLFLPKDYILEVKNKFYEYFTNKVRWGNNKKSLDFRYTWYKSAGGAVAYIMKYITKTFKNENDNSVQYASYWYIKNKVRRFLTSRSLSITLGVYRKVRHSLPSNTSLLEASKMWEKNQIQTLFDGNMHMYMKYDFENDTVDEVISWARNTDSIIYSRIKKNDTFKLAYKKEDYKTALQVYVSEFEKYTFNDSQNRFMLVPVIPSKLNDYQLQRYYKELTNLDTNVIDNKHYLVTQNEMIKRDLLTTVEIHSLSDEVYTVEEEYIDLDTGEFKTMNVVKTATQLGF